MSLPVPGNVPCPHPAGGSALGLSPGGPGVSCGAKRFPGPAGAARDTSRCPEWGSRAEWVRKVGWGVPGVPSLSPVTALGLPAPDAEPSWRVGSGETRPGSSQQDQCWDPSWEQTRGGMGFRPGLGLSPPAPLFGTGNQRPSGCSQPPNAIRGVCGVGADTDCGAGEGTTQSWSRNNDPGAGAAAEIKPVGMERKQQTPELGLKHRPGTAAGAGPAAPAPSRPSARPRPPLPLPGPFLPACSPPCSGERFRVAEAGSAAAGTGNGLRHGAVASGGGAGGWRRLHGGL